MSKFTFAYALLFATGLSLPLAAQQGTEGADAKQRQAQKIHKVRMKAWVEEHPKVAMRIRKEADKDGDGKLNQEEHRGAAVLMRQLMQARRERIKDRIDTNDNGKVSPGELRRAKKVKDWADRNNDGRVGPLELQRAKRVKNRVDTNDDGKVSGGELRRAKRVHDRLDRNDDGKVSRPEARKAVRKHRKPVQKR